ncbi:MAG TPA: [FeFe] hydrogenase H-cluster radical SAM maturase HydG [Cyanobacteria bacterium UBA8530]|nr:[FeFe] hydrogenase H-cluster radical SAM maturase HydG [Cyanobacteria bacterium UBA8530]
MPDFIKDQEIFDSLEKGKEFSSEQLMAVIEKARTAEGLSIAETAALLQCQDPEIEKKIFLAAREIKETIYGKRIVIFAPLYLSNHCTNNCLYCGYKIGNALDRRRLELDEIGREAEILLGMGHKRIVVEVGEDAKNCPIDYVVGAIEKIYETKTSKGSIRRINVNIAATTVENYRLLKEAGIGTYILFQETYHHETYQKMHLSGPKANYAYHLTAMDRAMEGGIDDVGVGVLFGLFDYRFEVLAMLKHALHLEEKFGVGPHTVSVPRLRPARDVSLENFPHLVSDHDFKKIVAIIRLAIPYTGLILSTREEPAFRDEVIALGVSQISAGSCTGVGGYNESLEGSSNPQFEVGDHRSPLEIIKSLCRSDYVPSYCTACYRQGRTGDRFMVLAKSGEIGNVCLPNALLTFKEFIDDFGDPELKEIGQKTIERQLEKIPNPQTRQATEEQLRQLENGKRDLYF